mgnify:CR=1 FL=1
MMGLTRRRFWPLRLTLAILIALFAASPVRAQNPGDIKKKLEDQRQSAAERKAALERLASREKGVSGNLADIDREAAVLAERIAAQEKSIQEIERQERKLANEYAALDADRRQAAERLTGIMRALWPAHLQNMENKTAGLDSWEEADRRFAWLAAFYGAAGEAYQEYKDKSGALAANMAAQDAAREKLLSERRQVNANNDELLAKRLERMRELRNLRKQRIDAEQDLKDILGVIGKLNYQLESLGGTEISAMKGRLPWPARGRAMTSFSPDGGAGSRGLGLALPAGTKVAAVHAGKVAHAEKLRGMGDVVIVSHGGNYYTVYAYLSDLNVKTGDAVVAGQPLGAAGYYPAAGGPGMYFELRFREKAINPEQWLSK